MADVPAKTNPKASQQIEGPPDESYEEKYNQHYEFPLSIVGSILGHILIAAGLAYLILVLMNKGEDKSPVAVKTLAVGGLDDVGDGKSGSGGQDDPIVEKLNQDPATAAIETFADPTKLPQIQEDIQKTIKMIDPTGNLPITASNAAAYAGLEKSIRDKLLGAQRGAGTEKGSGYDGSKGTGPGGTGADSTLGRSLRWNLRFKITGGRDYLEQLQAMKAQILIPMGRDKAILIEDLGNLANRKIVDFAVDGSILKFVESRPAAIKDVADVLGLDFRPTAFIATFRKEQQDDWAKKEIAYRNRRPEDIEVTTFAVTVVGGTASVVVVEQQAKR